MTLLRNWYASYHKDDGAAGNRSILLPGCSIFRIIYSLLYWRFNLIDLPCTSITCHTVMEDGEVSRDNENHIENERMKQQMHAPPYLTLLCLVGENWTQKIYSETFYPAHWGYLNLWIRLDNIWYVSQQFAFALKLHRKYF